jgi:hypothetical protein
MWVVLPCAAFSLLRPLIHMRRAVSMLDYPGVDPATFDVATFEDTLSPKLAHDLGLISKRPTRNLS